ncbi:MAG TPA: multiheme c-type cytochrome [Hanamia sp.]
MILLIISLFFFLVQCINNGADKKEALAGKNDPYQQYAGSVTCAKCHQDIYNSFIKTGHATTSQIADAGNILGSFEKGKNEFHYNSALFVSMHQTDSGFYEVENSNGSDTLSGKMNIIIGSGTRGQTYLSWKGDHLFQLPVSYLSSVRSWVNSPGDSNHIIFSRPVNARCLECHTTYADVILSPLSEREEQFDKKQVVYGIGCEKCHGPGAKHVEWQTQNPKATVAKYIINPEKFSRKLSIDLCRLCHGGKMGNIKPAFTFKPGDKLQDYFIIDEMAHTSNLDVHGNQYSLLAESKCYRTSTTMTCVTCHNTHDNERGNVALFSQRCMTCHNKEHRTFCKTDTSMISSFSANCIDCHMPQMASKKIVSQLSDGRGFTTELLRTHLIAVYPEATKNFLLKNKSK